MSFNFPKRGEYKENFSEVKEYLDKAKYPVIAFLDNKGIRSTAIRTVTNSHGKDGFSHAAIYVGKHDEKHEFAEAVNAFPLGFFARRGHKKSGYIKTKSMEEVLKSANKVVLCEVNPADEKDFTKNPINGIREYVKKREGRFNKFDNLNLFSHYLINGLLFPISIPYRLITGGRDLIPQMKRNKKKSCTSLCIDAVNDVTGIDITPKDKEKSFVTPQKLSESSNVNKIAEIYFD